MTTWLVCGGRDYGHIPRGIATHSPEWMRARRRAEWERQNLRHVLTQLAVERGAPRLLIHGAAKGADTFGARWAGRNGVPVQPFPADWYPKSGGGRLDRSAGPRRNERMLVEGQPGLVIAFPGNEGTADMVRRAKAAGVEVIEVPA